MEVRYEPIGIYDAGLRRCRSD